MAKPIRKNRHMLSSAVVDQSVYRRTLAAEKISASFRGGTSDVGQFDNQVAAHELAEHLIKISPFNKRWKVYNL